MNRSTTYFEYLYALGFYGTLKIIAPDRLEWFIEQDRIYDNHPRLKTTKWSWEK